MLTDKKSVPALNSIACYSFINISIEFILLVLVMILPSFFLPFLNSLKKYVLSAAFWPGSK